MLPHAARLAGSPYARSFTRGLALSLLQRKPDEWRRQFATPSSGGCANTTTASPNQKNNTSLKATAPSVATVAPTNDDEHHDVDLDEDDAGTSSLAEMGRGRKKRKRSAAVVDEIDALFNDAIGGNVVRGALGSVPAPPKSVTRIADLTLKQGRGRGDQSADRHADLGAVVDAIKFAPHREGKKRSKRRLDPTGG